MEDNIKVGNYIIIQKQNYKKLHKLNKPNSSITLGRDNINLTGIEGCPYFSLFKMVPNGKRGREYRLELTEETINLKDEIDIRASGTDNRNIQDDGRSQKLTHEEIIELTSDASKASDIVETLISNSNTFHNKTGFSQEKYLKKKEKKYFGYIQIIKPNLRIISEVMYRLDPNKIQNIRIDTLSQIMTMSNIHCEGNYLLYDSGSNGLLAAALLSAIGHQTNGKLIHMHPGNMSQKQALLAMNFPEEQYSRCISVNIYSALRQVYQGCDTHKKSEVNGTNENPLKRKAEDDGEHKSKVTKTENDNNKITDNNTEELTITSNISKETSNEVEKPEPKKPKWHYDNIAASELLKENVDGLVIACKEEPQGIFKELMPFVKGGRPFVIYYTAAEPLQQLYMTLKSDPNVVALRLLWNWMRNYQVR